MIVIVMLVWSKLVFFGGESAQFKETHSICAKQNKGTCQRRGRVAVNAPICLSGGGLDNDGNDDNNNDDR